MPEMTFEELTHVDRGIILIVGPRRCGKTHLCSEFLQRWEERHIDYRLFSLNRPSSTWGRWGGSSFNTDVIERRLRGHRVALIDEPSPDLRPEHVPMNLLVMATSEPQRWMTDRANWQVRFTAARQYWVDPGVPLPGPPPPPVLRLSLWERLSADDWCI